MHNLPEKHAHGEYVVDAPAALLNRLRLAAAARGEGRVQGATAQKILKDFGAVMSAAPGQKVPRRYVSEGDPRVLGGYTGAHKSPRDPQELSWIIRRRIAELGWKEPIAVFSVLSRWDDLMGAQFAQHVKPEGFIDGVLTVRCDSTAWATQVKLMRGEVLQTFRRELGEGIVQKLQVLGPQTPQWKRGRFVAPHGRGPRDTYG